MKRCYTVAFLISIVFLVGCTPKIQPGIERCIENCDKPGWIDHIEKKCTKEVKAFVGRSFRHSTERMALDYAKTNALDEALTSMWGTYGKRKIREVAANAGISVAEIIDDAVVRETMTEWRETGIVKGDFPENHIQKWEKIDKMGNRSYYYVIYRLFIVPREMVKDFLRDTILRKKVEEANEQTKRNIEKALESLERMQTKDFEDW